MSLASVPSRDTWLHLPLIVISSRSGIKPFVLITMTPLTLISSFLIPDKERSGELSPDCTTHDSFASFSVYVHLCTLIASPFNNPNIARAKLTSVIDSIITVRFEVCFFAQYKLDLQNYW